MRRSLVIGIYPSRIGLVIHSGRKYEEGKSKPKKKEIPLIIPPKSLDETSSLRVKLALLG